MDMIRKAHARFAARLRGCIEPQVTWRKLITDEMVKNGDSWGSSVYCTLSNAEMDVEFSDGFGATEGKPFTLWTKTRVYFPVCYLGSEWVGSASRDPDGKPTSHMGE